MQQNLNMPVLDLKSQQLAESEMSTSTQFVKIPTNISIVNTKKLSKNIE
jgi:hypothetical protein